MSCAGTVTAYSRLRPSFFVSFTCIEHPVPELFWIIQAVADGAGGGTRTPTTLQPPGPKPGASTNSATHARPASHHGRADGLRLRSAGMPVKQSSEAALRR